LLLAAWLVYYSGATPPLFFQKFIAQEDMESFAGDFLAARFALSTNQYQAAKEHLDRALEKAPEDKELLRRAIEFYFAEGYFDRSLELSDNYVSLFPYPIENPHLLLALAALREDKYAEAKAILSAEPKEGENPVPSLNSEVIFPLIEVWIKVGEHKTNEAIADLNKLKDSIALPLVQFQSALINEIAGNTAEAEAEFDAVAENAGHSLRVAQTASEFYTRIGKPDKAAEIQEAYLSNNPAALNQNLFSNKDIQQPINNARQGLADLFMEIASFLNLGDQDGRSLFYIRMATYIQPDFPHAKLMLANILRGLGRYQDAIVAYRQVTTPPSFAWQARINIARMYAAQKDYDKAKSLLLSMAEEDKASYDAYLTLADIMMDNKDYTQAVDFYSRAIERVGKPESYQWIMFYARGICYERIKKWDKAEADFNTALAMSPNQPDVLNYLAYSWLVMDKNLQKAFSMLQTAVDERPGDAHILDSYGWALFKLGKYDDAVVFLEDANEMMPHDPTTNDHLGDVYWKLGRKREARFQWKRALFFKPEPEDIPKIEQKLVHGLPQPEVTTLSNSEPRAE
jgi:tetratricopeptide (TPR) repeat protein